jgi:hypothetical protein
LIGDSENTFEDDDSVAHSENYPWAPQSYSNYCSPRKRPSKRHPWKKLQQEDESPLEKEAPVWFSNIRVMTPKVLNMNGGLNAPSKTIRKTSAKTTFAMPRPPVLEIVNRGRSKSDEASDISSLASYALTTPSQALATPTSYKPLGYSLEKGVEGWSPAMIDASISIVQGLERGTQMLENASKTPTKTNSTSKCSILLMNPRRKLFEIIQVSFLPEHTTVGDLLEGIRDVATDPRLAHQTYTGLAYQGMHISAPMVPVDMIVEAETDGKPLLAVPLNYSAGRIERMANIVLGLERGTQMLENVSKTPTKTNFISKCSILLMNPSRKLFEIIQVSFLPEHTTVGDLLEGIRDVATDPRLAHQTYTGLAYRGMHIRSPMVLIDMIVEAETDGKPLLVVPLNYSAGQIERMASELLE